VRRNKGAAGIDGETLKDIESYGVERMLEELRGLLEEGRYRRQGGPKGLQPQAGEARREAPFDSSDSRSGSSNRSPAGSRTHLRGQLLPCSSGFRPKSHARQALECIRKEVNVGGAVGARDRLQGFLRESQPRLSAGPSGPQSQRQKGAQADTALDERLA